MFLSMDLILVTVRSRPPEWELLFCNTVLFWNVLARIGLLISLSPFTIT